jgi:VanZ family protein
MLQTMKSGTKILIRLPAPLIAVAIFILSSQSRLPHLGWVFSIDKVQHCIAYFCLAATTGLWSFPGGWKKHPLRSFFLSAAIASLYGMSDEFHQSFVPGRDCSIFDWCADTIGALLGAWLAWFCAGRLLKKFNFELDKCL